jgi:hypothetical protein
MASLTVTVQIAPGVWHYIAISSDAIRNTVTIQVTNLSTKSAKS